MKCLSSLHYTGNIFSLQYWCWLIAHSYFGNYNIFASTCLQLPTRFFELNCVVLVWKLLFIVLCDRNEHRHHVSHQEIICLWNRTFLFVFNHSQRDVCLILSLPITLLRLCGCVCMCVRVYNGCPVFEHWDVHCYAVTIVWVEWDPHRSAWQPTIRLSLLTIVVGNLMKWWRGQERAGRESPAPRLSSILIFALNPSVK